MRWLLLAGVAHAAAASCTGTLLEGALPLRVPSRWWAVPPSSVGGCDAPEQCTATLPSQITGGTTLGLALSQRRCFTLDGENVDACCDGIACAAWAGAALQTSACMGGAAVYTVHAALGAGPANATLGGTAAVVGSHRYAFVRTPDWVAAAVDGVLVSNSSAIPEAAPFQVTLAAAGGAAPELSFTALPPGVPSGTPAHFTVGAGAVRDATHVMHVNTVGAATVVVPAASHGGCDPCPVAPDVAAVFSVTNPKQAAIAFQADVAFTLSSLVAEPLTDEAVTAALTPTAAEREASATPPPAPVAATAPAEAAAIMERQAQATEATFQIASALAAATARVGLRPPAPTTPTSPTSPTSPVSPASPPLLEPPLAPPPFAPPTTDATAFLQNLTLARSPPPAASSGGAFVGAFAVGAATMSDAAMSPLMSAAAGVPLNAVSTVGTLVVVNAALSPDTAQAVASGVAQAFAVSDMAYSVAPSATTIMLVADATREQVVAVAAMRPYAGAVAVVPRTVCVSVYAPGGRPANLGAAIAAVAPSPLMVATDGVHFTTVKDTKLSRTNTVLVLALGGLGVVVLVAAVATVGVQVHRLRKV